MSKSRWLWAAVLVGTIWPAGAWADTSKEMSDAYDRGMGALVHLQGMSSRAGMEQGFEGMATCVATSRDGFGVFMTLSLDPGLSPETLKDLKLITPGLKGKTIQAELIGIDALTGIGFIQAKAKHTWTVIRFSGRANLKVGQPVVSVGLLGRSAGFVPYVGSARVSTFLRAPEKLAYVSGGTLTGVGSPVFAGDKVAVGIVGRRQFYSLYAMAGDRGARNVSLRSTQETSYFTPAEEFADVLQRIGALRSNPRPPWLGVWQVQGVGPALAELAGLTSPGVLLEKVIPTGPAAKAGVKERDIVIAVNGKSLEKLGTPLLTARNLMRQISRTKVGEKVTLTLLRDKKELQVTVTLQAQPTMPNQARRLFVRALGLMVREKVAMDAHLLEGAAAGEKGLIVEGVSPNSAAAGAGLQRGDLITGVGNQLVSTVDAFGKAVDEAVKDSKTPAVVLQVRRGERVIPISVRPVR